MTIDGGRIYRSSNFIQSDENGRIISLTIIYKTDYGTYFEVDGDLIVNRELKVEGSVDYVKDWIREKLRKIESGQIKVVKGSSERKRDWKQEEEIRKQMWEDVNINSIPSGRTFEEIVCYQQAQNAPAARPSSPCRIL